jgi:hypothetical protein
MLDSFIQALLKSAEYQSHPNMNRAKAANNTAHQTNGSSCIPLPPSPKMDCEAMLRKV